MIEIRLHGRGGQGVVMASQIIATAAHLEGKYPQAFPMFGVERRGAPVTAFVRIDSSQIFLRTQIYNPDHLVVLDPTLLTSPTLFSGLKNGGWVVVNSHEDLTKKPELDSWRLATVDASAIAQAHHLGTTFSPIVNTAITGAFAKATRLVTMGNIVLAIKEIISEEVDANIAAATEAYDKTMCQGA